MTIEEELPLQHQLLDVFVVFEITWQVQCVFMVFLQTWEIVKDRISFGHKELGSAALKLGDLLDQVPHFQPVVLEASELLLLDPISEIQMNDFSIVLKLHEHCADGSFESFEIKTPCRPLFLLLVVV